ncbi:MAG: transposase, partial [Lactobacillales bacterium]|nr:transposase [Lactobacillales bacterium]
MGCIQMNRYPKEQKERILELYRSGHKVTDLAREYGIAEATIYKWKAELTPSKETGMTVEEIKAM